MTTLSYPVTGENITHAMWADLGSRHHAGVDSGMTLSLSSTSDVATVAVGSANFHGFQLDVTVAHGLTLPAVGTPTTYSIGIMYDPADESDAAGPLTLTSAVKSSLSIPSGGDFLTLYEVTRQASQTLNLAAVANFRTLRASLLVAPTGVTTPAANQAGVGPAVIVRRTGIQVQDSSGTYVDVKNDTGDVTTGFTASSGWTNNGSAYRILNGMVTLHLRATKTGSSITSDSTNGGLSDTPILTVPAAARSIWTETGAGSLSTAAGSTFGFDWRINAGGIWVITSTHPSVSLAAGADVFATAVYPL